MTEPDPTSYPSSWRPAWAPEPEPEPEIEVEPLAAELWLASLDDAKFAEVVKRTRPGREN